MGRLKNAQIALSILLLGLGLIWLTKKFTSSGDGTPTSKNMTLGQRPSRKVEIKAPPSMQLPANAISGIDFSKKDPEVRSLHIMANLLAQSLQPDIDLDKIVQTLKDLGLEPIVTRDANPYTGSLTMVRTNNPFRGTRNFHAQYFGEENGANTFIQHMSFEFKPGAQALSDAIEAVRINFPNVKDQEPFQTEQGSLRFILPNGYVVHVKKLTKEDISEPNPFQAYEPGDEGTVRVTLEIDESHDEPHEDHQDE